MWQGSSPAQGKDTLSWILNSINFKNQNIETPVAPIVCGNNPRAMMLTLKRRWIGAEERMEWCCQIHLIVADQGRSQMVLFLVLIFHARRAWCQTASNLWWCMLDRRGLVGIVVQLAARGLLNGCLWHGRTASSGLWESRCDFHPLSYQPKFVLIDCVCRHGGAVSFCTCLRPIFICLMLSFV